MDKADVEPTTAPRDRAPSRRDWLTLSRRQRQELIKQNRRHADEAKEAQQRPGSNAPPISDAEKEAQLQRTREAIAKALDRAQITHPGERRMLQEIVASSRAYHRGDNTAATALWALAAMVRLHDSPGSILGDTDALAHVRIMLHAIEDAVYGKPAAFLALLPERESPEESVRRLPSADRLQAYVAAGVEGLTGPAHQGGVTQKKASELVSEAFKEAGISITDKTVLEYFKRIRRLKGKAKASADARALYDKLTADLRGEKAALWPLPERKVWLKRLAEDAGRILETDLP